MKYKTGEPNEVGDIVRIEHGKTKGKVTMIIETAEEMKSINVDVPGVMLESDPFGLGYWRSKFQDDPAQLERKP